MTGLSSQFALRNDQHPKDLTTAYGASCQTCHDTKKHKAEQRNKAKNNEKEEDKKDLTPEQIPKLSFAQIEGKCHCCGKKGHKSPNCPEKDNILKPQWAINKTMNATFAQQ